MIVTWCYYLIELLIHSWIFVLSPPALPPKKRQSASSPTRIAVVAPMSRTNCGLNLQHGAIKQVQILTFTLTLWSFSFKFSTPFSLVEWPFYYPPNPPSFNFSTTNSVFHLIHDSNLSFGMCTQSSGFELEVCMVFFKRISLLPSPKGILINLYSSIFLTNPASTSRKFH